MNRLRPYDKEWLTELVNNSYSFREVLRKAGRSDYGGESYRLLKNKILEYDIDTSHFTGFGRRKDMSKETFLRPKYSFDEVFRKNSPVNQSVLRKYVKRNKVLIYECSICGFDGEGWEGKIALELDHINGNNTDNRIENLRYLCPNCHATTKTYRGRNKGK